LGSSGDVVGVALIDRETIYIAEPFPPAEDRVPYAEQSPLETTPGPPVKVRGED
jgi:hypothetical protein